MDPKPHTPWLVASLLALTFVGCGGEEDPRSYTAPVEDTGARQAEATRSAQEAARLGVIGDLYDQWQRDHLVFVGELEAAGADVAAIEGPLAEDPVRSIDELMVRLDPQAYDPALRDPLVKWSEACRDYDRRLRELGNDPSLDRRSPLRIGR